MKASSDMSTSCSQKVGFGSVLKTRSSTSTLTGRPANLLVGQVLTGQTERDAAVPLADECDTAVTIGPEARLNHHDGVAPTALRDHGVRRNVGAGRADRRGE